MMPALSHLAATTIRSRNRHENRRHLVEHFWLKVALGAYERRQAMTSAADEKDGIRELMARYCHALDACSFAEVASLFAEDGEWTTTYGSARGRAQIEALLA